MPDAMQQSFNLEASQLMSAIATLVNCFDAQGVCFTTTRVHLSKAIVSLQVHVVNGLVDFNPEKGVRALDSTALLPLMPKYHLNKTYRSLLTWLLWLLFVAILKRIQYIDFHLFHDYTRTFQTAPTAFHQRMLRFLVSVFPSSL
eukprot:4495563-Amphidinium_carterae.1